jgi:hypothetical protein
MDIFFLVAVGGALSALFWWVGQRPTVTAREQDNLIRTGHK